MNSLSSDVRQDLRRIFGNKFNDFNTALKSAKAVIAGGYILLILHRFYGEDETPGYAVLNLNFGNHLYFRTNKIVLKYGIENLLDTTYSTYADWNNISRQGRNFYMNLSIVIP